MQTETKSSSDPNPNLSEPIADLEEVFLMLWRQRGKILTLGLVAMAGGILLARNSSLFESSAKIYVRYVQDTSPIDALERRPVEEDSLRSRVINNEIEILTSADVAKETALSIGTDRIAAAATKPKPAPFGKWSGKPPESPDRVSPEVAGEILSRGLQVDPKKDSAIIQITYRNSEADLTSLVLEQLIHSYFDKHLEIHRPAAGTFVSEQTERLEKGIQDLAASIDQAMRETGIVSTKDCLELMEKQRFQLRAELLGLEAELAGAQARTRSLEPVLGSQDLAHTQLASSIGTPQKPPSEADIQRYQELVDLAAQLRRRNLALISTFTPKSRLLTNNSVLLDKAESERKKMAARSPTLVSQTSLTPEGAQFLGAQGIEIDVELANVAALQAKKEQLKQNLLNCEQYASILPASISRIEALVRLRQKEEDHLALLKDRLRTLQVDAALDSSKMPNLTILQHPTPPAERRPSQAKFGILALIAGLGLGVLVAFLIEIFLDRRVKTAQAFWKQLGIPLSLAVPAISGLNRKRGKEKLGRYAWDIVDLLAQRWSPLVSLPGPKIVAVTGAGSGAGATTITRRLSDILSAQGDKVLVLDQSSLERISASILGPEITDLRDHNGSLSKVYWERFARNHFGKLILRLQQSDYDYIFIDMALVGPGIPTREITRSLHKVLLVASPDRTESDALVQTYDALIDAGADVSCIFNKATPSDCQRLIPRDYQRRSSFSGGSADWRLPDQVQLRTS
jgi:uncharacterized protein involved in exopolysaccharide biosynthesis